MKFTLRYVINIFIFLWLSLPVNAQSTVDTPAGATTVEKTYTRGIRVGIDLSSLITQAISDDFKGFEVMADYRLTRNVYIAGEFGNSSQKEFLESLDYKSDGSYFKVGLDYNVYDNWVGMDNMIHFGFRIGSSSFQSDLYRYDYNLDSSYYPIDSNTTQQSFNGLRGLWSELLLGIKVEVFKNFYITGNLQLKALLSESKPENFDNLYIPGFGKTNDTSAIGVGFIYGVSYRIPLSF